MPTFRHAPTGNVKQGSGVELGLADQEIWRHSYETQCKNMIDLYLSTVEPNLPSSTALHTQEDDPVNHPSHYTSHPSGVEAIEITRHMSFNLGNAMKYLWRNGLKDGQPAVQDLEKAVWYIQDEIKQLKALEDKNS